MIIAALAVVITCATMVYNRGNSDAQMAIKLEYMQKQVDAQQRQFNDWMINYQVDKKEQKQQYDVLFNGIADVKMMLKDKADRYK